MVRHAYSALCLFPLSPRGAKARRATSTRREKGCAECSNRWDESSVLVRYALPLSSPVPISFSFPHCFLVSFICICLTFPSPHLPVPILFLPRSSGSSIFFLFGVCLLLPLSHPLFSLLLYALFLTCCPKPHQHSASHYSHQSAKGSERGRERPAKNRFSRTVTCPQTEK